MEIFKIWLHNIATFTGYVILSIFTIFALIMIITCIREKMVNKKYRKNEIRIPFDDYQRDKLGYTIQERPAAFILIDRLSFEEIENICMSIASDYEIYAVLMQDVEHPDRYISENIEIAVKNKLPIKRFIFSIPKGLNLHRFVHVSEVEHGVAQEKEYIYYTMYNTKKG